MENDELTPQQEPAEQAEPKPKAADSPLSGLYDRLPNIPLKALDIFIGICVAAFIAVIVVGFVQGHA